MSAQRKTKACKYTVAEFFCGCGGFTHGFCKSGRFRAVLGNDIKYFALETFRNNHTLGGHEPIIIKQDIRTVPDKTIQEMLANQGVQQLDCLIGGPPCQGFSQMRRMVERSKSSIVGFGGYNRLDQDPRNDLVLRFLEIAAVLQPKVVIIENVPQFLRHYHNGEVGGIARQVQDILNKLGYDVCYGVVNAADYGVPQLRERTIIIASRIGNIEIPPATHEASGSTLLPWITVRDALGDIPQVVNPINDYSSPPENAFQRAMRTSKHFPPLHITRTYSSNIVSIIRRMRPGETWDEASARERALCDKLIEEVKRKGESSEFAKNRLIAEGRILPSFYKKYYWSAYTRLAWASPALTITANANFLGSGRFTHPEEDRGITIREAARLQSFDDAFEFITTEHDHSPPSIGIAMDMIGEAVPPILAQRIAEHIAKSLDLAQGA